MKAHVFIVSLLALSVLAPAANALTVQNEDKAPYTLKITPTGGKEVDLAVKAASNADVDCKLGCVLQLGKESKTVDGKIPSIMIKNGKFI